MSKCIWRPAYIQSLSEFVLLTSRVCDSHSYLSLPLIPVEEFLELFPDHRSSSEHELMIARINHEHGEREKLEQARQELLKRKQALIAENKKRKDDLANLDQDLEKFIDVSDSDLEPSSGLPTNFSLQSRLPNQSKRSSRRNTRCEVYLQGQWLKGLTATFERRYRSRYPVCFAWNYSFSPNA